MVAKGRSKVRGVSRSCTAIAGVPACNSLVLGIDEQCHAPNLLGGAQTTPASSQQELTAQSFSLHTAIHSQPAKAEDWHIMSRESTLDDI